MIRPIDIKLNAAHPELPLVEATTFTGAPSSVFIRGVPKSVGNWSITAVNVAVTYPDNTTTTRAAVESAEGVWVATIPGTATSGRTTAGFRILADGIDENGAAVTGYVLGFADFSVLSFAPVPAPGGTFWLLRYFDAMPTTPKKGDVAVVGGILKYYNGTTWLPFGIDDYAALSNKPQINNHTLTGGSSQSGADLGLLDLAGNQNYSGVVNLPNAQIIAGDVVTKSAFDFIDSEGNTKSIYAPESSGKALTDSDVDTVVLIDGTQTIYGYKTFNGGLLVLNGFAVYDYPIYVSINNVPATFGPDGVDVGEYPNNKHFDWPTIGGTLALLQNIAPAFSTSATYALNALCVYNGVLYRCTTAVTTAGAWTGSTNWTAATVEDVLAALRTALAGKADVSAIPYNLVTKTISNGAVSLDDRAINAVAVSSSLASLTVNFPTATSGKARDFGLRLTVASGVTTAPELALPQGVTCENADGEAPEIGADGSATILYFTETASGVFLVKGEVVQTIS